MYKSIIDNLTDEEVKRIAAESTSIKDFMRKAGYQGLGNNSRNKVKQRINELNITFSKKQDEEDNITINEKQLLRSKEIGLLGELKLETIAAQHNINISKPIVDDYKYDLILEKDGVFRRIQVKSSQSFENNSITFTLTTSKLDVAKKTYTNSLYSINDFEYFFLYDVITDRGFLVKNDKEDRYRFSIRYTKAKNNQTKNINFADDYAAELIIDKIF